MSNGTGLSAAAPEPGDGEPGGGEPGQPGRRGGWWKLVLAALVAAYLALGGYDLSSASLSGTSARGTTAAQPGTPPAASALPAPVSASIPAPHTLAIVSVTTFGPDGASDGDHQSTVNRIDAGGQPWYSSWYATPEFGGLQSGTGLLLDMGQTVTLSSVRLVLGGAPGADVRILVGNSTVLADMIAVGGAADAGGTVRLPAVLAASGRYVLVWFTQLPPDTPGKYQVDVYDVTVDGAL
ncbi:MAG TPA: hypothetical protein VHZ03_57690 [Trebonia sp.]|nr:hypothetical protein [Trebonia sp.]